MCTDSEGDLIRLFVHIGLHIGLRNIFNELVFFSVLITDKVVQGINLVVILIWNVFISIKMLQKLSFRIISAFGKL